mgnify:FL=1
MGGAGRSQSREASVTPRSKALISVLKGTPPPDSPFTIDLLNLLVAEEANAHGKGGLSGRKMTFEELVNRWRYAQKEGGTAGEASIRTFEAIRKEWNCDRHLVREGLAQVCGEKPNRDMVLRALEAWDERGDETTPPGSANRRSRSQTPKPVARKENTEAKTVAGGTGTSCPHRDADGNRCGKRCTAHVLDSGAPTCGCPRGHRWDALGLSLIHI